MRFRHHEKVHPRRMAHHDDCDPEETVPAEENTFRNLPFTGQQ